MERPGYEHAATAGKTKYAQLQQERINGKLEIENHDKQLRKIERQLRISKIFEAWGIITKFLQAENKH